MTCDNFIDYFEGKGKGPSRAWYVLGERKELHLTAEHTTFVNHCKLTPDTKSDCNTMESVTISQITQEQGMIELQIVLKQSNIIILRLLSLVHGVAEVRSLMNAMTKAGIRDKELWTVLTNALPYQFSSRTVNVVCYWNQANCFKEAEATEWTQWEF